MGRRQTFAARVTRRSARWTCGVIALAAALYRPPVALDSQTRSVSPSPAVAVDQAGYLPGLPKLARVVAAAATSDQFTVRRATDDAVVLTGRLGELREDVDAGDLVRLADFTSVDAPGRYRLSVEGAGASEPFAIGRDVYDRPLYLALRAFYGQRCGVAVDLGKDFPGYRHDRCHLAGAYHPSSGRRGTAPSVKGWHDAGDYGRYMVTSGVTVGTLLLGTELYPERFRRLSLDIPESSRRTPDVLEEIRWNLDWMLSLQAADGGVFHKQTSASFVGMVMPDQDDRSSLIVGAGRAPWASTCATAQFAAATAAAARAFRRDDPSYARRLLASARRAWAWTSRHPDVAFGNPEDVGTGAYADDECGDDRLWAAVEVWRASGDPGAGAFVQQAAAAYLPALREVAPPGWSNVAALALWSYALDPRADTGLRDDIRRRAVDAAVALARRIAAHPSRVPLVEDDYVWGSNGVAANYGVQLLVASRWSDDPTLVAAALDIVHYLLGRNPFALSWLTQVGSRAAMHLHHRPSAADGQTLPWPGLLAGGPDRRRQDPVLEALPPLPHGRLYADDEASFASNEFAINWNAPLVVLLAGAAEAGSGSGPDPN